MFIKKAVPILLIMLTGFAQAVDIKIIDIVGGSKEVVEFKKVDEGELITFKIIVSNDSNCNISNLPKGSTYQNNIFSWVPDAYQAGMYPVAFHTTDANNVVTYKKIRIVVANRIFNILAQKPFEYLFMAMDPDEDDVEITVTDLPMGATFTGAEYGPKLFQWSPSFAQIGRYTMTLTATDNPSEGPPLTDMSNVVITVAAEALSSLENPCDFNGDNYIDEQDLSIFSLNWMNCINSVPSNCDPAFRNRILTTNGSTLRLIEFFVTVRVINGRTVYHALDCRDLRKKKSYEISLGRAKELGFTPHTKCKANRLLEEVNK